MLQVFRLAWRNLARNRRRSVFSMLALGIGLSLLLLMAAVVAGEMRDAMEKSIRLESGHLQVRAVSYEEGKTSLAWQDLIANPQGIAAQVAALPVVKAASPRLFASAIVSTKDESAGVRLIGIDPASPASAPYREAVVDGSFPGADDREGVLMGQSLAHKIGVYVGSPVQVLVNTSNGDVDEQTFVVRGLYSTRTPAYDEYNLLVPLGKAQAITRAGDRASVIYVLLDNRDRAQEVAAALRGDRYQVLTYEQMNAMLVQFEALSGAYMVVMYLIVLAITATVIVNTLVMAVFERTREVGILSAIGMRGSGIAALFMAESILLAVGGILMGLALGALLVAYLSRYGFYIGDFGITGVLFGERLYAYLRAKDAISLTLMALIVTLIAGLYPAILASRMEPVDALRGGE